MYFRKKSDLNPMLGFPSGICQVVERVDDKLNEGYIEQSIIEKVENGEDLDNLESSIVYPRIVEKPLEHNKLINTIELTSHAQYRMDLRGITTGDIKVSFKNFVRQYYNEKSQNTGQYLTWESAIRIGAPIKFIDKKLGDLVLAFNVRKGNATVKTVFFLGEQNPRPKHCKRKVAMLRKRLDTIRFSHI
jgi:hypothetical protein